MTKMVTISARIPKQLDDCLEEYAKENGYGTKTEVLRELLRKELMFQNLREIKGALKGIVPPLKGSMSDWRREQWQKYLKMANGDSKKAADLLKADEEKATAWLEPYFR